jgi:hypothetical protein
VPPAVTEARVQRRKMYSNLSPTAKIPYQKQAADIKTGIDNTVRSKHGASLENMD